MVREVVNQPLNNRLQLLRMEEISLPEKCRDFSAVVSFYQQDDTRLEVVEEQGLVPMVTVGFHNDSRASLPTSSPKWGGGLSHRQ